MAQEFNYANCCMLITCLEAQPPEKFSMAEVFVKHGVGCDDLRLQMHECGSAACIVGWIYIISGLPILRSHANKWLGISYEQGCQLFTPDRYEEGDRYPLSRAIATLKRLRGRFLATGEVVVDWGAEPTAGEPWTAPQAVETSEAASSPIAIPTPELFDPPELPETLTRLLGAKVEA